MRRTLFAIAIAAGAVVATGAAAAEAQPLARMPGIVLVGDDWNDWAKERRKREREAYKDWRKDQRERAKELRKAERDYEKAQRKYEKAHRRWARGHYLPAEYRASRYIIHDYRVYRLPPPPRGYGYVRYDDDILLTQLATGLITQVLADALR